MYRQENDFTNDLQSVFNLLSVSKTYKIIGSSNNKLMRFHSDYDLNETIPTNEKLINIYHKFKKIFVEAKKDKNIYITDFKCGEIKGEPIRWNYNDMMKGIKNGVKFTDALKNPVVCKLDIIVILDNKLNEITNNYFLGETEEATKKQNIESLENDFNKLVREKTYMKALKRYYSILKINNKDDNDIIDYLNSDVGLMSKVRSDLDLLLLAMDKTNISIDIIKHNLQIIKYELSEVLKYNFSKKLDEITNLKNATDLYRQIKILSDKIFKIVNKCVYKDFKKIF